METAPSPEILTPTTGGESEEEDIVMSDVHLGCPPNFSGPYISRFTFSLPPVKAEATSKQQLVTLDGDGDLVITRRSRQCKDTHVVRVQHSITSTIPSVGLQVWRAELALADFVLHKMVTSSEFDGIVAIELGAGTGLVGILLARVAKTVFLTDHGDAVLDNCAANVCLNSELFRSQASVCVRELDWKGSWPPNSGGNSASLKRFNDYINTLEKVVKFVFPYYRRAWTSAEVEEIQTASLIVAADVIYSDDLTDAFFNTLERLMVNGPEKVAYLALEKRYNFTVDDLNVVANGYSHFRTYLHDGECDDDNNRSRRWHCFVGERIDLMQIPQYLREYDRGDDVEIWQIKNESRY